MTLMKMTSRRMLSTTLLLLLAVAALTHQGSCQEATDEEFESPHLHSMDVSSDRVCQHDTYVRINAGAGGSLEVTDMPGGNTAFWAPLRVLVSFSNLQYSSQFCSKVGEVRADFTGKLVTCREEDVLTGTKRNWLTNVLIPEAVKLHTSRLQVHPSSGIKVPDSMTGLCASYAIPAEHQDSGENTDFILYVSAAPIHTHAAAWALPCLALKDGRPAVGVLNISPKAILNSHEAIRLVSHQMMHAFGFTASIFENRSMLSEPGSYRGRKNITVVRSPNVLKRAANQFKCGSIPGLELENEELVTKVGSHWKRRVAKDELMSGVYGAGYYTALSLAAMEDTGYYKAVYSSAEAMSYGLNAGCDFLTESCFKNGVSQFPRTFCSEATQIACTTDRRSIGECHVSTYDADVPSEHRYFSNANMGGVAQLMDYCPIYGAYSRTGCANGDENLMMGSLLDENSRCLDTNDLKVSGLSINRGGVCAKIECRYADETFLVLFKGAEEPVECPEGEKVEPGKYSPHFISGSITCPSYYDVCDAYYDKEDIEVQERPMDK